MYLPNKMKLPPEIWLEIEDIRRRDFKRRVEGFEVLYKKRRMFSISTNYMPSQIALELLLESIYIPL